MGPAVRDALLWLAVASLAALAGTAAAGALHVSELQQEARETLAIVQRGGPFPYERDGTVFGNYERLLPLERRGYYREYTVPTAGLAHRGTRRLIVGCERVRSAPRTFDGCSGAPHVYYTDDHYRSFHQVLVP
jgi:ribonuclease T1